MCPGPVARWHGTPDQGRLLLLALLRSLYLQAVGSQQDPVEAGKLLLLIYKGSLRGSAVIWMDLGRIVHHLVTGQIFQGRLCAKYFSENRHIKHTCALKLPNSLLNHH